MEPFLEPPTTTPHVIRSARARAYERLRFRITVDDRPARSTPFYPVLPRFTPFHPIGDRAEGNLRFTVGNEITYTPSLRPYGSEVHVEKLYVGTSSNGRSRSFVNVLGLPSGRPLGVPNFSLTALAQIKERFYEGTIDRGREHERRGVYVCVCPRIPDPIRKRGRKIAYFNASLSRKASQFFFY